MLKQLTAVSYSSVIVELFVVAYLGIPVWDMEFAFPSLALCPNYSIYFSKNQSKELPENLPHLCRSNLGIDAWSPLPFGFVSDSNGKVNVEKYFSYPVKNVAINSDMCRDEVRQDSSISKSGQNLQCQNTPLHSQLSESYELTSVLKQNVQSRERPTQTNTGKKTEIWRPYLVEKSGIKCPKPIYPAPISPTHVPKDCLWANEMNKLQPLCPKNMPISSVFSRTIGSSCSAFKPVPRKKVLHCPYPQCEYTFLNNGQLTGHIRGHTGDKPFKCDFVNCEKAFARNEELTRHKRIHSGEKPHECDVCHKRFGRKDHLNKHRKTHLKASEKRVYQCIFEGCGHSYTRSDALTRHLSTAHSYRHPPKSIC